jgi:hypothetical protein
MPYRRMTDHPDLERFMAKRMRAETIEVKAIPADAITFDPRSRAKLADGLPYRLGAAGNPAVPSATRMLQVVMCNPQFMRA